MKKITMKKIIAVTGTPGTGKTTLSGRLARELNAKVISLTDVVNENNLYTGIDLERDSKIVDVKKLGKFIEKLIKTKFSDEETIILEGLLSHLICAHSKRTSGQDFMPVTHVIVLRASPSALKQRLELRGYSKAKIRENIEAEFMGVCLNESLWCENVIEVDSTGQVNLNLITCWLKSGGRKIHEIDWTEDFCGVLGEFTLH